jgi:ATP-dependent helicase/nuclease subunit B
MQPILGPFHPDLEDALIEEIQAYKNADLFCPLLILVPSDSLRRWLKVLLVKERRLNLLNLHILTFHQLSLRLFEELHGAHNLLLSNDAFLEEALRQLIRTGASGARAFAGIEEKVGGCAALWQTLRDLKDGMVEPARALEALNEGHFGRKGQEKLSSLFSLFDTFLSCCKQWEVRDYSDLDILVMDQVPSSKFLQQFRRILYYGFYDLTQVQVELFHTISHRYPTTLFFPLVQKHPAWTFAQRFCERHVQGFSRDGETGNWICDPELSLRPVPSRRISLFCNGPERSVEPQSQNFSCTILSCSGGRDEMLTTAKEILRLVSEEGMAFDEIGVVARSLEPYLPWIKEIFPEHRIPIATSTEMPLVQFPLVKAVLQLIQLPSSGYLRSCFVDLVSSPFFKISASCEDGFAPRPDLWDILTRHLGIAKGLEQWRRLEGCLNREIVLRESQAEDENPSTLTIANPQVRILWDLFHNLYRDLELLPRESSWSQYASQWKLLLQKYLGIAEGEKPLRRPEREQPGGAVLDILKTLAGLDAMNPEISLDTFVQTARYWLEHSSIPLADSNLSGVAVLDAMAARGIPFRTLFILGLNEGMFPRTVREDAFLRDRHRRVLQTVLGYKVAEKLSAFDEEKLIFTLLVGAARERLYCLYQRSDETGRALAPSWYLAELRRALQCEEKTIPRGIVEKGGIEPFDRSELLLPEELAIRLSLQSQDPAPLVELLPLLAPLYERGRQAMKQMETPAGKLTKYDGNPGRLSEYWDRLRKHGISPTSLERYALCPFQFFARNILGLGWLERPEEMTVLSPSNMGEILHLILRSFYQELMDQGYFASKESPVDLFSLLEESSQKIFSDYQLKNPVGFPVAWEIIREELMGVLRQVVQEDLRELSQSGYRPIALESEGEEPLKGKWPAFLNGLSVRGRMDRIDHHPVQNRYRVIDYKFKSGRKPLPEDQDLCRSALQGKRLQPPVYLLLGKGLAAQRGGGAQEPKVEAAFYFLAPKWPDGPLVTQSFPADGWEGKMGAELTETLSVLLEGIHQGRFFIHTGTYCKNCEVSEVCRKNHLPSLWRAENDPATKPHDDLRKKKLPK